MKKLNRLWVPAAALSLFAVGCGDQQIVNPDESLTPDFAMGRLVQSVSGSGSFTFAGNNRTFSFTARLHADGTVDGEWERVNHIGNASQTKSHGEVTCFTIIGTQAWLGGLATSGLFSAAPNNGVAWRVADNSEGANSPPDQITAQFVGLAPGVAAASCAATPATLALNNVEAGNIQVRP